MKSFDKLQPPVGQGVHVIVHRRIDPAKRAELLRRLHLLLDKPGNPEDVREL